MAPYKVYSGCSLLTQWAGPIGFFNKGFPTWLGGTFAYVSFNFFSIPLKNWNIVILAGGLDIPRAIHMPFNSWKTSLPPPSWAFFGRVFTQSILAASSSEMRYVSKRRQFFWMRRRLVTSPDVSERYGQFISPSSPLTSSWNSSASLGPFKN